MCIVIGSYNTKGCLRLEHDLTQSISDGRGREGKRSGCNRPLMSENQARHSFARTSIFIRPIKTLPRLLFFRAWGIVMTCFIVLRTNKVTRSGR